MTELPVIGITVGDPSGIGPEIVLAAAAHPEVRARCTPLVIGSRANLDHTIAALGLSVTLADETDAAAPPDAIRVRDVPGVPADLAFGVASAEGGRAAYAYIAEGVALARCGAIASLVTAPINKVAMQLAGLGHTGHTEMLAEMTGAPWSLTLFTVADLRVLYLTRHLSLRDAIARIDQPLVVTTLERFMSVAPMIGLRAPKIAVQGLNPHCGEGGLFGTEDDEILAPAVAEARRRGIDVHGPIPADSVFSQARQGRWDVVLGLYHDMAAAICKTLDFHGTVSTTLGLPFLRFSVDHGTAFDIAGKGIASPENMVRTLLRAAESAEANS